MARPPRGPGSRPTIRSSESAAGVVDRLEAVRTALAEIREGETVALVIRRGSGAEARELRLVITAEEGL